MVAELEILARAHELFSGQGPRLRLDGVSEYYDGTLGRVDERHSGAGGDQYRAAVTAGRAALRAASDTDAEIATVIRQAQDEHRDARDVTGRVLQQARADAAISAETPLAQREAMRRRAQRLRTQHRVVSTARRRALRRAALLRLLRYRAKRMRRGARPGTASGRAELAVRAALSKLGRPYVWGATGPDQFDCSGLMQWAYRQAGVDLQRTTYDQIHQGIAVPVSQVRPGDLVFPHTGHVQMAIGNGMVVEAPYSGANVRISRLGEHIAIRRPI